MLTSKKKDSVIKKAQKHEKDTGSSAVQISILTERINELTKHLKKNKKDNHSRRGLLKMVAKRRSHMQYLQRKDKKQYDALIKKLGIKSKK